MPCAGTFPRKRGSRPDPSAGLAVFRQRRGVTVDHGPGSAPPGCRTRRGVERPAHSSVRPPASHPIRPATPASDSAIRAPSGLAMSPPRMAFEPPRESRHSPPPEARRQRPFRQQPHRVGPGAASARGARRRHRPRAGTAHQMPPPPPASAPPQPPARAVPSPGTSRRRPRRPRRFGCGAGPPPLSAPRRGTTSSTSAPSAPASPPNRRARIRAAFPRSRASPRGERPHLGVGDAPLPECISGPGQVFERAGGPDPLTRRTILMPILQASHSAQEEKSSLQPPRRSKSAMRVIIRDSAELMRAASSAMRSPRRKSSSSPSSLAPGPAVPAPSRARDKDLREWHSGSLQMRPSDPPNTILHTELYTNITASTSASQDGL